MSEFSYRSVVYFGVGHAAVQVDDGLHIPPPFGQRANVVDSVSLYQFTRLDTL